MTTSTDNKKIVKPKGPIRTEAVVPIAIILLLSFLYFRFLFDGNLRKAIEWVGTYVHGAEVNVGSIQTSFLKGHFFLNGLQITDKENPAQNLLEINQIRAKLNWDALLRVKFVVDDAGVEGIQLYSKRKRPGYVKPPEPDGKSGGALDALEKQVTQQTKEQFSGNALGHVATLLEGTDEKEVLNNIKANLKAEEHIKKLKEQLKEKEKAWRERIDKLPQKDDIEALNKRAKALKFDSKDPRQFADDLKELKKITKEADAIIDNYKSTSENLKSDSDKFKSEFKQIDELVKQDIKDLEAMAKIPDLDLGDFSKDIFGSMFSKHLVTVQKYMEVGRKYMPPPKDPNEKKEELIPPARGKGKNYQFPITVGYPLFWLKKASISSEPNPNSFSGKVSGVLTNATTDPAFIKKPMILDVTGDFPQANIFATQLKVTVDHIAEPKELLELTVGSFPFTKSKLVNDSNLELGVKKSQGNSRLVASLFRSELNVDLKNEFKQIEYDLEAKSSKVKEAISTILGGIPVITLNARATGSWQNLDLNVNSNLGKELSRGLKDYVQAKVNQMKQQVRELVEGRIKEERAKLNGEFDKLRSQVDGQLGKKKEELEAAKAGLKDQAKAKESGTKEKLKDDLKEKGKKLLKGIKF